METNAKGQMQLHDQPPPYAPPQSSSSTVIVIPPAVTTASTSIGNLPNIQQGTVVTSNVVIPRTIGPIPTPYVCPSCNNTVVTRVEASTTTKQHLFALLLCAIGCWLCVIIPYFIVTCRKADHFCPICNSYIGTFV